MKSILVRMSLIQLGLLALLLLLNAALLERNILPSFRDLEQQEAHRNLDRVSGLVQAEIDHLATTCLDWSAWDDTYRFARDLDRSYIESNLTLDTLTSNRWNLLMIIAPDGRVLWRRFFDLDRQVDLHPADLDLARLPADHLFLVPFPPHTDPTKVVRAGLLLTGLGPTLIASRPILHNGGAGTPDGYLVIGKVLDRGLVESFSSQLRLPLNPTRLAALDPARFDTHGHLLRPTPEVMRASLLLQDLRQRPALALTTDIPRDIARKGEFVRFFSYLIVGGGALLLILGSILALHQQISRPLSRLALHARTIAASGDLSTRLNLTRQDEIGVLAQSLDQMVASLADQDEQLRALHDEQQQELRERLTIEAELRKKEELLQRAKRMESVGLLAGGVAHDINNMLSAIVSYPDLLLRDPQLNEKQRHFIQAMHSSGKRIAVVVSDLLTLSKGIASVREVLSVNSLIQDFLASPEMLHLVEYHPQVAVETDLAKDLLPIRGSDVHLRKLVLNLVSNAAEAITGPGRVLITTQNVYLERPLSGYEQVVKGEYLLLRIDDDGPGIPESDLPRIFEPFFTKKTYGRSGTGLGLAVVWNTVQEHGGYLQVSSAPAGTRFEVFLPIVHEAIPGAVAASDLASLRGRGETILVVDDVDLQRETLFNQLTELGYQTITATSGEKALEMMKSLRPELLILDMIMDPGIDGLETYRRVLARLPGQKALILSGYSATGAVDEALALGASEFLAKPVTLERLARAVRQALGAGC